MKSFHQFINEAELRDKEGLGSGTGMTHRSGEKIGTDKKKSPSEKKRVKAIGRGKTAPAKDYKPRKDIGKQKPRSEREQQPTQARGTAGVSGVEAQKKAYRERKARERGEKIKTADELLTTKSKKKEDPDYKPVKSSGLTTKERKALYKKGERTLRDIRLKNLDKTKESELKHKVTSK